MLFDYLIGDWVVELAGDRTQILIPVIGRPRACEGFQRSVLFAQGDCVDGYVLYLVRELLGGVRVRV